MRFPRQCAPKGIPFGHAPARNDKVVKEFSKSQNENRKGLALAVFPIKCYDIGVISIREECLMQGVNTTLCYIERDGCYLMLHRVKKDGDLNRDKWIGVGGKFEDRESPEDCVLREALEETGLTLIRPEYRGIVTFVSDEWGTEYMHLFRAVRFTGSLKTCDEGDLEWVPKEKLWALPQWEGDKIFLRLLEEKVPFFSLKLCYAGDQLLSAVLNGASLPVGAHIEDGENDQGGEPAEQAPQKKG